MFARIGIIGTGTFCMKVLSTGQKVAKVGRKGFYKR
jgi:hypothetical protein